MSRDYADLYVTASHEAAHACACIECGYRVGQVSIVPDEESFGRVRHAVATNLLDEATICLAGVVAHCSVSGAAINFSAPPFTQDLKKVESVVRKFHGDDITSIQESVLFIASLQYARKIVSENQDAIARLAVALLSSHEMDGEEAEAIYLRHKRVPHWQSYGVQTVHVPLTRF
jgi:hypothetical protein